MSDLFRRIKDAVPLWEVAERYGAVQSRGGQKWMPCLFHNEKTASMILHKDRYHCFACGEKGDVFDLVEKQERLEKVEAIKFVARLAGIPEAELNLGRGAGPRVTAEQQQERDILLDVLQKIADYYQGSLGDLDEPGSQIAREALDERRLTADILTKVGFGYAPDNWNSLAQHLEGQGVKLDHMIATGLVVRTSTGRPVDLLRHRLVIPIRNKTGQVVSFAGRHLPGSKLPPPKNPDGSPRLEADGSPAKPLKYINGKDSEVFQKGEILFGLEMSLGIRDYVAWVLCEGYFDALALIAMGIPAVAPMGTALTDSQAKTLARSAKKVVSWYDPDKAGQKATWKNLPALLAHGVQVEVMRPLGGPSKMDPDEVIRTKGTEVVRAMLAKGSRAVEDWTSWLIPYLCVEEGISRVRKQDLLRLTRLVAEMLVTAYPIKNPSKEQIRLLAWELEVPETALLGALSSARLDREQERLREDQEEAVEGNPPVLLPRLEKVIWLGLQAMCDGDARGLRMVGLVDRAHWELIPNGGLVLEVLDNGGVPVSDLAKAAMAQAAAQRMVRNAAGDELLIHQTVRKEVLTILLAEVDESLKGPEAVDPAIRQNLVQERLRLRMELNSLGGGHQRKGLGQGGAFS